jgi:L-fuconolactonase
MFSSRLPLMTAADAAHTSTSTVDAHHHFWRFDPAEYDWIDDSMSALRRDFLPADLAPAMSAAGMHGAISVQARQTLDETRWLLSLAEANDFIVGVVGWVPLASPSLRAELATLAENGKLRGVRHVVQGEADPRFLERPDFNAGVNALGDFGLAYDILIYERQLPAAIAFVDRHPGQVFVLDHAGKPRVRECALEPWRTQMRELARRPNVYCKLSGLVTEAAPQSWADTDLRPYIETMLEAFGPARVMFGSDWPVCLLASDYNRWADTVRNFTARLSASERAEIFGGSARRAYRFGPGESKNP